MKKFMMVIALLTLSALVSSSFADVQNIRLSGDVRIRGYYNTYGGEFPQTSLIAQRTRITCEADLEDHVLVVVTLKAYGRWGTDNATWNSPNSAGIPSGLRNWGVGMDEAYVQMNELFFQAATLKLGRQYLHYGRGLIISSFEQEKNFDAARLVLDYYPLTVDLVGALETDAAPFAPRGNNFGVTGDFNRTYMLFANARYEMTDSFIKDIEAYAGYMAVVDENSAYGNNQNAPVIIGLRGDLKLTKNLQAWVEGAYETGKIAGSAGLREAFLANVGAQLSLGETQMSPALHVNYTFASGDGDDGDKAFSSWYELQPGYNGYLLKPALSNIHIFNAGATVKPAKNCTAGVDVYYYMASTKSGSLAANSADLGGFVPSLAGPTGRTSDIGWEVDATLGYDYSKDVRFQLITGLVIPGKAIRNAGQDDLAIGVRGEVAVKF